MKYLLSLLTIAVAISTNPILAQTETREAAALSTTNDPASLPELDNQQNIQKAITLLKQRGATFKKDANGEIVYAWLLWPKVTDEDLVHLKAFKNLQEVHLGLDNSTDAGLVHLKGLTSLKVVMVSGSKITDAGLVHLKALKNLQTLDLNSTKITDAGLVHLQGMTSLENLNLAYTDTTEAGWRDLKKALQAAKDSNGTK